MSLRFAFAGDRKIAVQALEFLVGRGAHPLALLLPDPGVGSHGADLMALCPELPPSQINLGRTVEYSFAERMRSLDLDVLLSVHYPHLLKEPVLSLPRHGCLNLHPAFLPFNRGWHTPSWAILEGTPIGATLHMMESGVDSGDIIHQKEADVLESDTADTLYQRLLALELDVLMEAWPWIEMGTFQRRQQVGVGTTHKRDQLFSPAVQEIDLDAPTTARSVLRQLRALTTNSLPEAAYFIHSGTKVRIQLELHADGG